MAAPSLERASSSSTDEYDVFLSFRGEDTRDNFTSHLHRALLDANITTFKDDEDPDTGVPLKPVLESAIKASRASIIVLSENYANSSWCLDELVLILAQRESSNKIVIPIFYYVKHSHVKKQEKESTFGVAMANHRKKMEEETSASRKKQLDEQINRWSGALTEVAGLISKNIKDYKNEAVFIEEIVEYIESQLPVLKKTELPQLIGMEDSIKIVTDWLTDASTNDASSKGASSHIVDILTIVGMCGSGKTSLAKYVYYEYCRKFQKRSFIEGISERCPGIPKSEYRHLTKKLHKDISKRSSQKTRHVDSLIYTSKIENIVTEKKVFLVLDGVDCFEQLDALLGKKSFCHGSKVIITTRNPCLTERCALFRNKDKCKHVKLELQGLSAKKSLDLFCFHAFTSKNIILSDENISKKFVKYCRGHPKTLKTLGEDLRGKSVNYWNEKIEWLRGGKSSLINEDLKKSYDSLPFREDKDLFKHIACFFVGADRCFTETILKACGIKPICGITKLIERCLLKIGCNNKLVMHQLLQDMVRFVIKEEFDTKPSKQSRFWCNEESLNVLKKKEGTKYIQGLTLDMKKLKKKSLCKTFELEPDALRGMINLKLLKLNHVKINGSCKNFPEELRWLCMHGFPLNSIPSDLKMGNLVALDMSYSSIKSFGIYGGNLEHPQKRQKLAESCSEDKMLLGSLKFLNLSFCDELCSLGGFDELPALTELIVTNCGKLVEVCETIEKCGKLVLIDMSKCNKLRKLPRSIGMLPEVKTLSLNDCNLGAVMDMDSSSFPEATPSDTKFQTISLPRSLVKLSLTDNNLNKESFPMSFSYLSNLQELYLDGNPIPSLPMCVESLPCLEILIWTSFNCKCGIGKGITYKCRDDSRKASSGSALSPRKSTIHGHSHNEKEEPVSPLVEDLVKDPPIVYHRRKKDQKRKREEV